ncbi:MAG TPA: HAD-IB family hydrolase [Acidimicrobiia bacterium]|nr:HAD-IB family hydrolase [Acidimicrobiia bacterium]
MSGAAFFDVDNTLIKGSVLFHAGAGMVRHGLVTRRDIARHAAHHVAFRWRGEDVAHLARARAGALALCTGLPVDEVVQLGEQVYDERLTGRIWEGTRGLADQHVMLGEPVWLVTGAPLELAQIVARRLHLTGALGTVAEIDNGAWTGRLVGDVLHGPAKATAVRALAAREGLDLGRSSAYSDSINDLPMLESVAFPHAVNPDRRLRCVAEARGWPVHDFRTRTAIRRRLGPRHDGRRASRLTRREFRVPAISGTELGAYDPER